jgi:hypothetical protein
MRAITTVLVLGTWAIVGCGGYEPAAPPPAAPGSQQAKTSTAPKAAPAPAPASAPTQSGMTANMAAAGAAAGMASADLWNGPEGVQPARPSQPAPQVQPAPQPNPNAQKADVGAGKQGRDYGGGVVAAPVTTPVATYFAAKEMIAFRIQIPGAMKNYKALNGSAPKTQEEFMEKIIKEHGIQLPQLPVGQRYVYFPDKEDLFVEHPQ